MFVNVLFCRDKPPAPSDGEKIAIYFNIACCHSQLGNTQDGLFALKEALALGYSDVAQLRTDTDLAELRKDAIFDKLLDKYCRPAKPGFFQALLNGF